LGQTLKDKGRIEHKSLPLAWSYLPSEKTLLCWKEGSRESKVQKKQIHKDDDDDSWCEPFIEVSIWEDKSTSQQRQKTAFLSRNDFKMKCNICRRRKKQDDLFFISKKVFVGLSDIVNHTWQEGEIRSSWRASQLINSLCLQQHDCRFSAECFRGIGK